MTRLDSPSRARAFLDALVDVLELVFALALLCAFAWLMVALYQGQRRCLPSERVEFNLDVGVAGARGSYCL